MNYISIKPGKGREGEEEEEVGEGNREKEGEEGGKGKEKKDFGHGCRLPGR